MRAARLFTLIALLGITAAPAFAQAVVVGGGRAELRVTARVTMPEIRILRPVAEPVATWEGGTYTEYQVRYTIAANTHWALVGTRLPVGVTLLDEHGFFVVGEDIVALRGEKTNPAEVLVRVRVATDAGRDWAQALAFELRAGR
jgi:hypothetical protein